jgi:hypothetical protein
VGREIKTWARGVRPWGDLRLYEVGPTPTIQVTRLDSSADPATRHAAAAFDDALGSTRSLQRYWFAAQALPGWTEVEFARPVPVDVVALVTRSMSPELRTSAGVPTQELRVEGMRRSDWIALETRAGQGRELADGWRLSRLMLAGALDLQGIRLVYAGPDSEMAPMVAEITLLHEQKPYVWLLPD